MMKHSITTLALACIPDAMISVAAMPDGGPQQPDGRKLGQ